MIMYYVKRNPQQAEGFSFDFEDGNVIAILEYTSICTGLKSKAVRTVKEIAANGEDTVIYPQDFKMLKDWRLDLIKDDVAQWWLENFDTPNYDDMIDHLDQEELIDLSESKLYGIVRDEIQALYDDFPPAMKRYATVDHLILDSGFDRAIDYLKGVIARARLDYWLHDIVGTREFPEKGEFGTVTQTMILSAIEQRLISNRLTEDGGEYLVSKSFVTKYFAKLIEDDKKHQEELEGIPIMASIQPVQQTAQDAQGEVIKPIEDDNAI